ncbi:MAG: class A beta-lactamase-related serine hydrolase [Myxococcales bacterium]|nr:MAG: class A beta-lactamase-related serine hydrolase [Myxococcales bacterium]
MAKYRAVPFIGLVTVALAVLASLDVSASDGANSLRERLSREVDRFADRFDGVVLVAQGKEILVERALGVSDGRNGAANRPDTLFRIGSISKQMTAVTILVLAEEGKVELDASLSYYLPEYPRESLSRDGVEVTIEHLLHHTSGVVRAEKLAGFESKMWSEPIRPALFLSELSKQPLEFTPGTKYAYSNSGYMLLGEVVRRVTGDSFEAALRSRLLDPLGMTDTGIALDAERRARLARGRFPLGSLWLDGMDVFNLSDTNLSDLKSSGAVFSSARDLWRWTRLFRDPDSAPLRRASIKAMTTPGLEKYGYGVVVEGEGLWRQIWHNGAISPLGFSSELAIFPEQGFVVVVLSNDDYVLGTGQRLRKNLVAVLKDDPPAQKPEPGLKEQLTALGIGGLMFFKRGEPRLLVAPLALVWWLWAAMRRRPRSRLSWLEKTLSPLSFAALGLGVIADGAARSWIIWSGSAGLAVVGWLLASRIANEPWADKSRLKHATGIGISVLLLLFVGKTLDPVGIPRLLVAWSGSVGALALSLRKFSAKNTARVEETSKYGS